VTPSGKQHWNLSQAAAWVVFRDPKLVKEFNNLMGKSWSAHLMYPTMQTGEQTGKISDLCGELISGSLVAWGRPDSASGTMQEIAAIEWESLHLDPPNAYRQFSNRQKEYPWLDIRVKISDMRQLWPGPNGETRVVNKRSRKNWNAVDRKLTMLSEKNIVDLGISDRQLANRLRTMLEPEYESTEIPSKRSLRDYISKLRKSGQLPTRN
jgi:Fe-S cluster biosynthesis and repair protein YggX